MNAHSMETTFRQRFNETWRDRCPHETECASQSECETRLNAADAADAKRRRAIDEQRRSRATALRRDRGALIRDAEAAMHAPWLLANEPPDLETAAFKVTLRNALAGVMADLSALEKER